jgi:hypothetical protein
MKTFFNILQTISDFKNKHYLDEPFTLPKINSEKLYSEVNTEYSYTGHKYHINCLMNIIFYKEKDCGTKNKFSRNAFSKLSSLNTILENSFYKNEIKEEIFDIFSKTQKCYFAFTRLVHIYKIKKHPYIVTDDLMMNKLDINHKLTFILVENKTNFLFNINQIINIIETAIENSPNFVSQPLSPLNPYNNQPFTQATLYNIYFQMKYTGRVISMLFHCFFLENFHKNNFSEQYESLIRENAIKKYVFNSPHTILYSSVISMLGNNEYTKNLIIHKKFPKYILVDIFRPFLFYYYIANFFTKGTSKLYNVTYILNIKLKKFYEYNKVFGRQIIKLIKKNNKIEKQEYIFNTKHISFYEIIINSFITQNEEVFFSNNSSINILINNTTINFIRNDYDETI